MPNIKKSPALEISEKKTSKLGYLLLTIMVFIIVIFSQNIFHDIHDLVTEPIAPSYELNLTAAKLKYVSNIRFSNIETPYAAYELDAQEYSETIEIDEGIYEDGLDYQEYIEYIEQKQGFNITEYEDSLDSGSIFNSTDKLFKLDESYAFIQPTVEQIMESNREIASLQFQLSHDRQDLRDQDPSLQPIQIQELKAQIANLEASRDQQIQSILPGIESLQFSYQQAYESYKTQLVWFDIKVFLLSFLVIAPFFFYSLRYYFRLKHEQSAYTIIFTATTTAFAILFVQVVASFLLDILPMSWLQRVFSMLLEFEVLRYIIYYISLALLVVVFGGIVYFIQKKIFSSSAVAHRRLAKGHCPSCEFRINYEQKNCSNCGIELLQNCHSCHKPSSKFLDFCRHCGKASKTHKPSNT